MDGIFYDNRVGCTMAAALAEIVRTFNLKLKLENVVPIIKSGGDNLFPLN